MASISMEAEPRTSFGKGPNRRLRAAGRIPAVLYGGGKDSIPLSVDPKAVANIIRSHGGVNTIFELSVKGAKGKDSVMIREYQIEPVEHSLLHADLVRVAMDKAMTLTVSIELVGTAVGVKQGGGMLDFVTRAVEISCLPTDIPETLVVEVTELDVGDYIRASALSLPKGVTLESEANVVIAHVLAPKAEVEEVPEGEAAAEGAEAPEGAEGAEAPAEGGETKE